MSCEACVLRPAASLLTEVILWGKVHGQGVHIFVADLRPCHFAYTSTRGRADEASLGGAFRGEKSRTRWIDGAYDKWLKSGISHIEAIGLVTARLREVNLRRLEVTRASRGTESARAARRAARSRPRIFGRRDDVIVNSHARCSPDKTEL
jgi:hypothetical protein